MACLWFPGKRSHFFRKAGRIHIDHARKLKRRSPVPHMALNSNALSRPSYVCDLRVRRKLITELPDEIKHDAVHTITTLSRLDTRSRADRTTHTAV